MRRVGRRRSGEDFIAMGITRTEWPVGKANGRHGQDGRPFAFPTTPIRGYGRMPDRSAKARPRSDSTHHPSPASQHPVRDVRFQGRTRPDRSRGGACWNRRTRRSRTPGDSGRCDYLPLSAMGVYRLVRVGHCHTGSGASGAIAAEVVAIAKNLLICPPSDWRPRGRCFRRAHPTQSPAQGKGAGRSSYVGAANDRTVDRLWE